MTRIILTTLILFFPFRNFAQNIPNDFKTSSNNVKYKIFKSNSHKKIEVGDRVEMNIISIDDLGKTVFDSRTFNNNKPISMAIPKSQGEGDSYETILLLNEGDSAIFYIQTEPFKKRDPNYKTNSKYLIQYLKIESVFKLEKKYPIANKYLDDKETLYLKDDSNKIITYNSIINSQSGGWNEKFSSLNNFIWKGSTENGFASGQGYLAISDKPYGKTMQENSNTNGIALIGEMWNGKFQGGVNRQFFYQGNLIRQDSLKFKNGVIIYGKLNNEKDGSDYTGELFGSAKSGFGTLNFKNGGFIKGNFSNDNWDGNGNGKIINEDKSWYEGEFKNGVENGKGTLRMPDGKRYTGNFVDGKPNGKFKIEAWSLMGVVSNKWEAEYNMGKLVSSNQTDNSLDNFLSGSHSSYSSNTSSSNSSNTAKESNSSSSELEIPNVKSIEYDKKTSDFVMGESEKHYVKFDDGTSGYLFYSIKYKEWFIDAGGANDQTYTSKEYALDALYEYKKKGTIRKQGRKK